MGGIVIIGFCLSVFICLLLFTVDKHDKLKEKIESRKGNNCDKNNEMCCSDCICYDK